MALKACAKYINNLQGYVLRALTEGLKMNLANFPELMKLPKSEKLKLADQLWLAGISDSMPVPAEQAQTLDERWASYRAGKTKRISMAELERRLKKK